MPVLTLQHQIITKSLVILFAMGLFQPALALVFDETPHEVLAQRAEEVEKMYLPLIKHAKNIPDNIDSDNFDSDMSMAELIMLSSSTDNQQLALLDQKFGDSIDSDAGQQVIDWLTRQNALELSLLNKLGSYTGSNPECTNLINIYQAKIISANESILEYLNKYNDGYKIYNLLVQWVFSMDYLNRIYIRQEALILTNVCINPTPFISGESLREPLPEAVYIGKPVEPQ